MRVTFKERSTTLFRKEVLDSHFYAKFCDVVKFPLFKFHRNKKKIRLILQSEAAECAHACFTMILNSYGLKSDIEQLKEIYPTSMRGISLKQLTKMATQFGLSYKVLRLEMNDLEQIKYPAILHWNLNHFVILEDCKRGKLKIYDPALGIKHLKKSQASKHFTGIAVEFDGVAQSDRLPLKKNNFLKLKDLIKNISGLRKAFFSLFFLACLLQSLSIVIAKSFQVVIDSIIKNENTTHLILLGFSLFFVKFFEISLTYLRNIGIASIGEKLNLSLSEHVFTHVMKLPLDFFQKRHVGDIVSRFESVEKIRQVLTNGLINGLVDGLMSLTTLLAISYYSFQIPLLLILVTAIFISIRLFYFRLTKEQNEALLISKANESQNLIETVRGIQTIKIFEKENLRTRLWQNKHTKYINAVLKLTKTNVAFEAIKQAIFSIELLLTLFFCSMLYGKQQLSIGSMYSIFILRTLYNVSITNFMEQLIQFKLLPLHKNRLQDIISMKSEISTSINSPLNISPWGDFEINNLSYRYTNDNNPIFKNLNFIIEKGKSTVIIAPSGFGKTTLLKILMGLIKPTSGKVTINNQLLHGEHVSTFRKYFAAIMQDDQLFAGTIEDNISFFDDNIDTAHVIKCSQLAQIYNDINAMPMKFQTLIGELGMTLSGGQKQRILLARALYAKPKVLFMDEATSHLDLNTEHAINEKIKSLNITRIIVAHRKETIAIADKIIDLTSASE